MAASTSAPSTKRTLDGQAGDVRHFVLASTVAPALPAVPPDYVLMSPDEVDALGRHLDEHPTTRRRWP